ncbi:protocadherin-9-like [Gigantopelta aegis]|uniref:protocadherin-9-like n=1 Tax=Gigantopelta aegis TaxID=1735272 RepID=UPI001B888FC1|nr:protocadherin-9-like [Gigantopelta aegis]XP_041356865.1 protocadherin-9-like [Gigantopelta aegis]XP_041356866.1 protocadherin-9-like [Gigantopelta aegis]XP_041356867.1 protocadherin-9-like [Gigantopelta aegis]
MMAKTVEGSSLVRFALCWVVVIVFMCTSASSLKTSLQYTVQEEVKNGTLIGNIAIDSKLYNSFNQEQLENIQYTLTSTHNRILQAFTIHKTTSSITTAGRLDRETLCASVADCILKFDVNVYIRDSKSNTFDLRVIRVQVTLEDINDNFPTFPETHIFLSVSESVNVGHISLISGATDKDTGKNNSVQSYVLQPDDGMFSLTVETSVDGSTNLGVKVLNKLDRETQDFYSLEVIAEDGGHPPNVGTLSISLTVTDANDNNPFFLNADFNISVPEDYPVKSTIIKFSADDKDIGLNGKLVFQFSSRTSPRVRNILAVNESTGVLYSTRQLDYEEDPEFQFFVEVHDHGNPSLSSQASVIVNVLDVNDNAPELILTLHEAMHRLPENIEMETFIGYVSVSDKDSGQNGEVACDISDEHFKLMKFSEFNYYKIIVDKPLDFETLQKHNVSVTCTDMGIPSKSTSSLFNIQVLDVNDSPPMFPNEVIAGNITENNKIGQFILQLSATDVDGPGNNNVTFAILEDSSNMVRVSLLGEVTANKSYDREETITFQFIVIAQDSGSPSLFSTATVVVLVLDQNDSPPRFTQSSFTMAVVENTPAEVVIGKVTAIDPDEQNEFYFSFFIDNNVTEYFSIESDTGTIVTDKVMVFQAGTHLEFGVVVVDLVNPALIDFANVTVNITDDYDLAPTITFPQNDSVTVTFGTVVGSIFTTVQAHDDKSNDKLTFSINYGNKKDLFFINSISGEVIIAREITAADAGTYEIIIGVHDAGTPRHSSFAKLYVVVTGPAASASTLNDNIIIVVILVCVTLVLSLAISVIICLIRKIDTNRKKRRLAQSRVKTIYTIENEEYCVDEKDSGIEEEKLKELEINIDDNATFEDNSLPSPASYTGHDRSFSSTGLTPRKLVHFDDAAIFSKMIDAVSDSSGGTDSGRGCSDEENHSVRGSLQILKHSDSIYSIGSYV